MERKEPEIISDVLNSILSRHGYKDYYYKTIIIKNWSAIVGELIAENAECVDITDGKLYIKVKSCVWRQEISFFKKDILREIKKVIQSNTVKDIVFY